MNLNQVIMKGDSIYFPGLTIQARCAGVGSECWIDRG